MDSFLPTAGGNIWNGLGGRPQSMSVEKPKICLWLGSQKCATGRLYQLRVVLFCGSPCNKSLTIWGFVLGPPLGLGNYRQCCKLPRSTRKQDDDRWYCATWLPSSSTDWQELAEHDRQCFSKLHPSTCHMRRSEHIEQSNPELRPSSVYSQQ